MTTTDKFILLCLFLAENDALDKFLNNIDYSIIKEDEFPFIISGFEWLISQEGSDFWCKLDNKWEEFVQEYSL